MRWGGELLLLLPLLGLAVPLPVLFCSGSSSPAESVLLEAEDEALLLQPLGFAVPRPPAAGSLADPAAPGTAAAGVAIPGADEEGSVSAAAPAATPAAGADERGSAPAATPAAGLSPAPDASPPASGGSVSSSSAGTRRTRKTNRKGLASSRRVGRRSRRAKTDRGGSSAAAAEKALARRKTATTTGVSVRRHKKSSQRSRRERSSGRRSSRRPSAAAAAGPATDKKAAAAEADSKGTKVPSAAAEGAENKVDSRRSQELLLKKPPKWSSRDMLQRLQQLKPQRGRTVNKIFRALSGILGVVALLVLCAILSTVNSNGPGRDMPYIASSLRFVWVFRMLSICLGTSLLMQEFPPKNLTLEEVNEVLDDIERQLNEFVARDPRERYRSAVSIFGPRGSYDRINVYEEEVRIK
ncbi:hypothetical protein, conserved [Eimeria maxima]|uniref:Transmembrane protein n=1 Tax=Eimeria maxima TaxID=5804 RepID=U6M5X3_EIMMA|nr:hypothetical protein, conserved [Eimeria maxima]CDJ57040.1 hypothetical protein, conserved [Eimeria maxima]